MGLLDYFLRANLFLVLFYACYWLMLRRHTFFTLNRAYLLLSAICSLLFPLIELPQKTVETVALPMAVATLPTIAIRTEAATGPNWELIAWGMYGLLLLAMLGRLETRLVGLMRFIRRSIQEPMEGYTLVWPHDPQTPTFSFFRYFVLNPSDAQAEPVHRHEMVHIRQLHSADVLFFELLQAVFWINPVLILYKQSIRQIHEYLADREAANEQYAAYLVEYAFGIGAGKPIAGQTVTHSFLKPSQLKTRLQMLRRQATSRWAIGKYFMVLPLAVGLLAMTTAREQFTGIVAQTTSASPITVATKETIIKGKVATTEGKALAGATVIVMGTTVGAQTDAEGKYQLKIDHVPTDGMLVASFVGYKNGMEPLNGRSEINFSLEKSRQTLNEVVVVGYETPSTSKQAQTQKEVFTVVEQQPEFPGGMGALGQFLARNIRYPTEALRNGIQGAVFVEFVVDQTGGIRNLRVMKGIGSGCDEEAIRVVSQMPTWKPGQQNGVPVDVQYVLPIQFKLEKSTGFSVQSDSARSSGTSIKIRGNNQMYLNSKPLYIIDGILQESGSDLQKINPNDIESINVLKGASATAVYGDKGADGVIIIKTKSAKRNEKTDKKD